MISIFYINIKFEMEAFLEKPLEWAIFINPYCSYTDLSKINQIVISRLEPMFSANILHDFLRKYR